ncbi:MAG: hypothetical protein HeimC3_23710 [Candidatus Heimdallarchaeota archaeon LC_3]|nr:MAG: hypothetical protein HeimC3_23710 [Candidatus Heimdallarchaeota archaeon LC_3]
MSRISFFHLIQISVRFLGRKPEKTLIFIRDISIPIILLISISAIITSFNSNIIFLSSLAGEDSYLSLREKEDNLENSLVPLELEELIKNNDQNILAILPINQKDTSILVTEPYQGRNISFQSQIIGTNLSKLSLFWDNDLKEIKNINISSMQVNEVIIGEKLAEDLNILEENFPINLFIPIRDNNNFYLNLLIVSILKGNTIYTHSLLVNNKVFISFESAFESHSNYLLIKVKEPSKIGVTKQKIMDFLDSEYENSNFQITSARGSSALLDDILFEIVDKLRLFNMILIALVIIRLFQAVQWLTVHYELDMAYLKIIGQRKYEISLIMLIMGLIIGNLSLIIAIPISLLLPLGIALLLAMVTQEVFIPEIPTIFQIGEYILLFWVIFLISSLIPSIQLASKDIMKSLKTKD